VDISWLGHACVRIRTRHAAVVMDPADKSAGFDMGRPTADIVTVSRHHPHHDHVAGVRGQPIVIDGPGEYEISGVQLFGVPSPLPGGNGNGNGNGEAAPEAPGRNTAFLIEAEGLRVAHLGGGCAPPRAEEAELFSNVDILIVAIDGEEAIEPAAAARTVRDLEPTIVIPVSYPGPDGREKTSALGAFLEASGLSAEDPQPKLSIQPRGLGEQQRVVLLEARGS
jgi:L-ascorbate metabolism protein UlaG (beta-lactamase superfamily)